MSHRRGHHSEPTRLLQVVHRLGPSFGFAAGATTSSTTEDGCTETAIGSAVLVSASTNAAVKVSFRMLLDDPDSADAKA